MKKKEVCVCVWCVSPQVDKPPKGAGPLRTVKSDEAAEERATAGGTLSSVRPHCVKSLSGGEITHKVAPACLWRTLLLLRTDWGWGVSFVSRKMGHLIVRGSNAARMSSTVVLFVLFVLFVLCLAKYPFKVEVICSHWRLLY